MNSNKHLIQIKLSGQDITPAHFSALDLSKVLKSCYNSIQSFADNRTLEKDFLSLTDLNSGSVALEFHISDPKPYDDMIHIIDLGIYQNLSKNQQENLNVMQKLSRTHGFDWEFCQASGKIVKFNAKTQISPKPKARIQGETQLYGKILRLGGIQDFKVQLDLEQGGKLNCNAPKILAEQLGARLYSMVGLEGLATWNSKGELLDFEIKQLLPYQNTDIKTAITNLKTLLAGKLDHIDAQAFVENLRKADI